MSGSRLKGALLGLLYAFLYGVWVAVFASGGGHGFGLTWVALFVFVDWLGLYFVIMGALVVDLRSLFSRIIFGSLAAFHIVVSAILVLPPIVSDQGEETQIFRKSWSIDPSGIVLCGVLHVLPSLVAIVFLVKALFREPSSSENNMVDLGL